MSVSLAFSMSLMSSRKVSISSSRLRQSWLPKGRYPKCITQSSPLLHHWSPELEHSVEQNPATTANKHVSSLSSRYLYPPKYPRKWDRTCTTNIKLGIYPRLGPLVSPCFPCVSEVSMLPTRPVNPSIPQRKLFWWPWSISCTERRRRAHGRAPTTCQSSPTLPPDQDPHPKQYKGSGPCHPCELEGSTPTATEGPFGSLGQQISLVPSLPPWCLLL